MKKLNAFTLSLLLCRFGNWLYYLTFAVLNISMLHSRRQTTFSLLLLFSLGVLFLSLQVSQQNGPCDNGFFAIQADEETSFDDGIFAENYLTHTFDAGLEINGCSDGTRIVSFQPEDKICFSKLFLSYRKIII